MLVVAKDTDHANASAEAHRGPMTFFDGQYKGKVITVHSQPERRREGRDRPAASLGGRPDNPTEIVIHVNMLKEGWDVTNLYTIVPLRAANSRTLVEQSIGRGLRLPYGKRTGVAAVDRLTIVSHDKLPGDRRRSQRSELDHPHRRSSSGETFPTRSRKLLSSSPTMTQTSLAIQL